MQRYKKANFRGVEFFVGEAQTQFGRRNALHEYPQKSKPYAEDLGRKAQTFSVEGYVLGEDFRAQLDRVIAACEAEGAAYLVHPYYGRKFVVCQTLSVSETSTETGIARFSLSFVEAGEVDSPLATEDAVSQVSAAAENLTQNAINNFVSKFSVSGQPEFVVASAISKMTAAADLLDSRRGNVSGVLNQTADFTFAMRNLRTSALSLVNNPKTLASSLTNAMSLLTSTFGEVSSDTFNAQKSLFSFGSTDKPVPQTTSTRAREEANRTALNNLVKHSALANAAAIAVQREYESTGEAEIEKGELLDQMDLLEETAEYEVFEAIRALRAKVARHVPNVSQGLPSITTFKPLVLTNTLLLSHNLYNSLERAEDISKRNGLRHPGFIEAGLDLEVLSNE